MSVMGFQKRSLDRGWVGVLSSIQFYFRFLEFVLTLQGPTYFCQLPVFFQNLVVAKPDPVVGDRECEDVINERLTLGVVVGRAERLNTNTGRSVNGGRY